MSLLVQALIWIVGIGITVYVAVFEMFIGGWVDVITSVATMIKESVTNGLIKDLVWGIAKIIFASLTGWFILLATSLVSTVAKEYLD